MDHAAFAQNQEAPKLGEDGRADKALMRRQNPEAAYAASEQGGNVNAVSKAAGLCAKPEASGQGEDGRAGKTLMRRQYPEDVRRLAEERPG